MIRLHVPDDLAVGAMIALPPEQAHYLTGVMRRKPGDDVSLFNGRAGEWRAFVAEVSKRGCGLRVEARARAQTQGPDLELVTALVKRPRLETIIEKAAELGACGVRLVTTRRTNAERANLARLQAIAVEASEQTGRLDVPAVSGPMPLERLLDGWQAGRRLMYCDEAGEAAPALEVLSGAGDGPWAILIGPEGGFAPEERERLRALSFVTPVSLGPRILRADSAAIAALTLWQAALGDWRSPPAP